MRHHWAIFVTAREEEKVASTKSRVYRQFRESTPLTVLSILSAVFLEDAMTARFSIALRSLPSSPHFQTASRAGRIDAMPPSRPRPESAIMTSMDDTTQARIRWFHPTPGRIVIALLAVEALLRLSERFGLLGWHKGYAVLTAAAVVGAATPALLAWFALALVVRRQFQFSIRSLLVLVVVVALPCSWLGTEIRAAKAQNKAVQGIVDAGGWTTYDYSRDASGRYDGNSKGSGVFAIDRVGQRC